MQWDRLPSPPFVPHCPKGTDILFACDAVTVGAVRIETQRTTNSKIRYASTHAKEGGPCKERA
ncbi:MAG: hypothetical protein DHS20C16_22700 [Phycisphaerae bacterium]|nr:MAG: hypothetical protein DHS20C16_22700 [Phycisphaerae bacterium]